MANSGTVTAGSAALASQYNNLRDDVLSITTGHTHTGASENGAKVAATGVSSGTAALNAVLTADGSGGASFLALSAAGADFQEFTTSGSWVKPSGKTAVYVLALGGGGGGGGNQVFTGNAWSAQGGAGGGHAARWMKATDLAGTVTVTIGAGGTGEVSDAADTDSHEGAGGGTGGDTSFGTALIAFGGGGGGQSNSNSQGYVIGGSHGKPVSYGRSKQSQTDSTPSTTRMNINFLSDAATGLNLRSGMGGNSALGTGYAGMDTMSGAAGGGAGGGPQAAAAYPGGAGGRGFGMQLGAAASGGSVGVNGSNAGTAGIGNGGGGGGGRNTAGTAGSGGNGYLGGGGGGGGAACNQSNTITVRGGNGGAGGGGYMLVISI